MSRISGDIKYSSIGIIHSLNKDTRGIGWLSKKAAKAVKKKADGRFR